MSVGEPVIDQPPDWNALLLGFEQAVSQGTRPIATQFVDICRGMRESNVAIQTLVAAVQEMQVQIAQLQSRVAALTPPHA